ncbi:MAG TPA: hypothetical protein P5089_02470 [Candidatus Portnoybacteria bacterium]|nr:hypothetical protein [Candidatus Portnoybacteria bacterium]
MKIIKIILSIFAILFGVFIIVYGGYGDSSGAQGLGVLVMVFGIIGLIKSRKNS